MRVLLVSSFIWIFACAGTAPVRTQYLLRAEMAEQSQRVEAPVAIGLGRVLVASYLEQPGLVVETDANQVRPARFHVWAEPLDLALRGFLRSAISSSLGFDVRADSMQREHWDRAVDVAIDQLHGTRDGAARLVAGWRVTPRGGEPIEYRFVRTQLLASPGYDALVDAEIALALQLAGAIADSLRE